MRCRLIGFGSAEFLRPEGHVEFLEHPAYGFGLFHERFMADRPVRVGFRHGFVDELFGFVGFPCPAHVAVLVVFALARRNRSACRYRSMDGNAPGGVLPMKPGKTSVAMCSPGIDCSTLSRGRSALPDTALSTSA